MNWTSPPPMYRARLLGGPFDGDEGVVPELAPRLWAYACPEPGCPAGGSHWTVAYDDLPDGVSPAAYDFAETEGSYNIYVYAELAAHLGPQLVEAEA